tara:strand:- start:2718 stop:3353 length:636 start_codon:yes stop_codon:yes gene_type:complete
LEDIMATDTDLEYLRSIAESGRQAPLLGGRYFVWWGLLAAVALLVHWSILTGALSAPPSMVGAVWFGYGIIGMIGSRVLSLGLRGKPGIGAVGNLAERAVWNGVTATIFFYAIGTTIAVALDRGNLILFDTIPVIAFCGYGISFHVTAAMGGPGWMKPMAWTSWTAAAGGLYFVGTPELYLYAAGVVLLLALLPGLIILRDEPKGGQIGDE